VTLHHFTYNLWVDSYLSLTYWTLISFWM